MWTRKTLQWINMLYALKTELKDKTLVKIGYTTDIKNRMSAHYSSNPDIKLLATMPGSREDEKLLHDRLQQHHYKGEWFYYNHDEFKKIWNGSMRPIVIRLRFYRVHLELQYGLLILQGEILKKNFTERGFKILDDKMWKLRKKFEQYKKDIAVKKC